MTRVLSALVLLPIVIGAVWLLPPVATLALALIAAVFAFAEYVTIAAAPRYGAVPGAAVLGACAALGSGWPVVDVG
jgi:CDP-diglyceride synthetase